MFFRATCSADETLQLKASFFSSTGFCNLSDFHGFSWFFLDCGCFQHMFSCQLSSQKPTGRLDDGRTHDYLSAPPTGWDAPWGKGMRGDMWDAPGGGTSAAGCDEDCIYIRYMYHTDIYIYCTAYIYIDTNSRNGLTLRMGSNLWPLEEEHQSFCIWMNLGKFCNRTWGV